MGILTDDMNRGVWDHDHLVYTDIRSPGLAESLAIHPGVEINVVDPIARKGSRFMGTGALQGGRSEDDVRRELYEYDDALNRPLAGS
jgi:hypothetical protein